MWVKHLFPQVNNFDKVQDNRCLDNLEKQVLKLENIEMKRIIVRFVIDVEEALTNYDYYCSLM